MSAKITVQEALSTAEGLMPRVTALTSSAASFQATDGVEKVMMIHNNCLAVNEGLEIMTPHIKNVQRPVSVDDGKKALKFIKELQVSYNAVLGHAVNKKPYFDALGVANITALISQDIKMVYTSFVTVSDILIDAAPAELQTEAKATRKEFDDGFKKVMAIYQ